MIWEIIGAMCGRFTYENTWPEIVEYLKEMGVAMQEVGQGVAEHPPRYNIAPTQPIITLRQDIDPPRQLKAELMRWGLVPTWVKDPTQFSLIINARAETIREKPSFRGGLRHHRCLIPASGYYEWHRSPDGSKQPHHITSKDGTPMMFAGIYASWMGPSGEEIDTTAIITVPANDTLKHIHDRMPVLIAPEDMGNWLDVENFSENDAAKLLRPAPVEMVVSHPVSKAVGSNRSEGPKLIEPITLDEDVPPSKPIKSPKPPKKPSPQGELF